MNIIDSVLIIIILLSVYNGWRKGFILGVLELITWAGSLIVALLLYGYVATFISAFITSGIWLLPVSLLITLVIVRLLSASIANIILGAVPVKIHNFSVNKAFGVLPGMVNGGIYAVLLVVLLLLVPISDSLTADMQKSRLAPKLSVWGEWLQSKMDPVFEKFPLSPGSVVTENPGHDGSIKLPFTVTTTRVRPDLEAEMLVLVNKEREKAGLKALKADPEVAVVARAHSADMFSRGYFSHITPEKKDPFDRMKKGGIKFLAAGENLALAPTLEIAHRGLMNSPGHKANILHKSFGRLGIGILDGGKRGLMITQNFRN